MIESVNKLSSVGLSEEFSLSDLNNNLINSDKEVLSETVSMSGDMSSLVRSSGQQEHLLGRMNTTLSMMYSDGQSDDLQQQKLRASVDAVGDKIEEQEVEAPVISSGMDDDFDAGGVLGIIAGMASLLLFTPIGKALGKVGEDILRGIGVIRQFTSGIFKPILTFLKESKIFAPIRTMFSYFSKLFKGPLKLLKGASKIFQPVFKIFKLLKNLFTPLLKFMPMISKIGGSVLKGVLGKVIMPIMTLFDGLSGWFNADEISGKKEEMLTTGDKVMASIASIISGFSFGLLDVKGVFKFLDESWTSLKEKFKEAKDFIKGVWSGDIDLVETITNFTSGIWKDVSSWFSEKLDAFRPVLYDVYYTVKNFITDMVDFIMKPIDYIKDFAKGVFSKLQDISFKDFIPESIKNTYIGEKLLSMLGDGEPKKDVGESKESKKVDQYIPDMGGQGVLLSGPIEQTGSLGDIIGSAIKPIAQTIDNTDMRESQTRFSERQQASIKNAEDKKPIIVPQIQTVEKPVLVSSRRVMSVDDIGIGFMNNGVFD